MKVLVIGGMGLIGGSISEAAARKRMEVFILSRRPLSEKWKQLGVKGFQGDWHVDQFAKDVVKQGFDVIVDTQVFNRNQLIRSMDISNGHCKQYIYISTDSVYLHPDNNVTENKEIALKDLKWGYGYNKRDAELYLLSISNEYDFFWTGIRPTVTFGNTRIPVGYASKRSTYTLPERILSGKPILRFEDDGSRHAICHVSTFGNAVIDLFLNQEAVGQFYHIADDKSYSYDELFDTIEKILGVKGKYIHISTDSIKKYNNAVYEEMIYDKNPNFTVDNQKIKKISPRTCFHVDIYDAMKSTLGYLKENSIEGDKEYNLITDVILLKFNDRIVDSNECRVVKDYINGLSPVYVEELKRYDLKMSYQAAIWPIKNTLRPIKKQIEGLWHR